MGQRGRGKREEWRCRKITSAASRCVALVTFRTSRPQAVLAGCPCQSHGGSYIYDITMSNFRSSLSHSAEKAHLDECCEPACVVDRLLPLRTKRHFTHPPPTYFATRSHLVLILFRNPCYRAKRTHTIMICRCASTTRIKMTDLAQQTRRFVKSIDRKMVTTVNDNWTE